MQIGDSEIVRLAVWRQRESRLGDVRFATEITAKGTFTDFVPDSDIPTLLRKGALEAAGGQVGSPSFIAQRMRPLRTGFFCGEPLRRVSEDWKFPSQ